MVQEERSNFVAAVCALVSETGEEGNHRFGDIKTRYRAPHPAHRKQDSRNALGAFAFDPSDEARSGSASRGGHIWQKAVCANGWNALAAQEYDARGGRDGINRFRSSPPPICHRTTRMGF